MNRTSKRIIDVPFLPDPALSPSARPSKCESLTQRRLVFNRRRSSQDQPTGARAPASRLRTRHASRRTVWSILKTCGTLLYSSPAVAKLGLRRRGPAFQPAFSHLPSPAVASRLAKERVDRLGHRAHRLAPPALGDQVLEVPLVGDIADLDQHGWHVRRLQHPEAGRFQRMLVHPHRGLHLVHQAAGRSGLKRSGFRVARGRSGCRRPRSARPSRLTPAMASALFSGLCQAFGLGVGGLVRQPCRSWRPGRRPHGAGSASAWIETNSAAV